MWITNDECSKYIKENSIVNFFLISAMGINFDKYIERLKNRAKQLGVKNVIYCDRFDGRGLFKI